MNRMPTAPLRRRIAATASTLLLVGLGACSATDATSDTGAATTVSGSTGTSTAVDTSSVVSGVPTLDATHADDNDLEWDAADATVVSLEDGGSAVDGSGAEVDGDVVSISAPGTYLLSGTLSDGQVVVDSDADGKVVLVLDGVDLTSASSSPLVIAAADEAVVVLADGSDNTLSDTAASASDGDEEEDAPNATLFSMADLTIGGEGALTVHGLSNDGITSKDGLVILSGDLTVDAVDDGIRGKDYLVVEDGTLEVDAGGDGLKADNEDVDEYGWILLEGGTVTVTAGSDGADAVGAVYVVDGELDVPASEEGLEAMLIRLTGGSVSVNASDDGLNATAGTADGGAEQVEDGVLLDITGGTVQVWAGSDGIDSNGQASITGGTVVVSSAAAMGGNGVFDVNGAFESPGVVALESEVSEGERVSLVDDSGTVVATFVATADGTPTVAAADLVSGTAYDVWTGAADADADSTDGLTQVGSVTASDASVAGGPGGFGGGRGGPGGGPGGPGGERGGPPPGVGASEGTQS